MSKNTSSTRLTAMMSLVLLSSLVLSPAVGAEEHEETTWDGLVQIEDASGAAVFIHPDADFSVFRRVSILEPSVAFRSNWRRDQNRGRSTNVSASDVERIQADVASLFVDAFTQQLEAAGYDIVNYVDEDVLIVRPAIVDLDINAPDTNRAGRNRTYTTSAGAATLFVELYDALTGELIGRAVDRRTAGRRGGFATRSNRVTNRADASREFRRWADQLVAFLDEHYIDPETEPDADD